MADASGSATDSGCLSGSSRPETRGRCAGREACFGCSAQRHLAAQGRVAARHEAVAMSGRAPDYLFGQSAGETERLRLQARMFAPYTARFLEDAGVSRGMKVLDVGTGAGDVALLVADLVGQEGTVVGVDFNAGADRDGPGQGRGRGI